MTQQLYMTQEGQSPDGSSNFLAPRRNIPSTLSYPMGHTAQSRYKAGGGATGECEHQEAEIIEGHLFFFGCATWHEGSWFPDQGLNPCSLQWKGRVLTIGLLGKFPLYYILGVSEFEYLDTCCKCNQTQYLSFCYRIAAAKSLQSCPTLCNTIDSSTPGSPVPGFLQARILEWVAISFSNA